MRSHETVTVPDTLACRRPCAQRHALCARTARDPCGPARSLRGPCRESMRYCRPRLPETAADAVSMGSPRLDPGRAVYGVNASPSSGYLDSEHAT